MSSRLDQASTDKIAAAEKELTQLEAKYKEIAADASLAAASMAPPPVGTIADAVSLGKSLITGDWGGALLDAVGFIPLFGDAAKAAGKGAKLIKTADALKTSIKTMSRKLGRLKDGLLKARKTEAKKYWDEITKIGRKKYDEAIAKCTTEACRKNVPITTKGEHYKYTPAGGKGKGDWIDGTRGDGKWKPDPDSKLGKQLEEFSKNKGLNPSGKTLDSMPYKNGFPNYDGFVAPIGKGKAQVEIPQTGNNNIDFKAADEALKASTGKTRRDIEEILGDDIALTWHHKEDGVTMQLIPQKLHGARNQSGHAGGGSSMKNPEF